jgi:CRISPR-associated protein Csd1
MILQALNEYYQRKIDDPDPAKRLPAFGLEQKEIPFVLEITADGQLLQLRPTYEQVGKKRIGRSFRVPQAVKKTSGVAANLLWDSMEYVLGIDTRGKPERVVEQHAAFRALIEALPARTREDEGIQAVLRFLGSFDRSRLEAEAAWPELLETNPVMSFLLHGDVDLVCQRPAVVSAALNMSIESDARQAMCLVSGDMAPVERLHAPIKGVWGSQTSGANIVSFNARAFESYGKTQRQGENAPVSKAAAFAYTTALNHLLRKDSPQRMQVGDASTVFWAEQDHELEAALAVILGEAFKGDPDGNTLAVRALYSAVQSGSLGTLESKQNRFHVLGLAPNAARVSIRFYHCLPLHELAERIVAHFEDLKIVRGKNDKEYPSLSDLLKAVAARGEAKNIPPLLGGAVLDAVLIGERALYPPQLLNAAIVRCKADQAKKDDAGRPLRHVSYARAAILKASINRYFRIHESNRKEINVSLDTDNSDPPYVLGRLFSVYERVQEIAAERDLNRTIRDTFFGAAMATPITVFPRLVRLNQHHLRDVKRSRPKSAVFFDFLLQEINGRLVPPPRPASPFPASFGLRDQGVFALGYYHQRQALFTKSDDTTIATQGTQS